MKTFNDLNEEEQDALSIKMDVSSSLHKTALNNKRIGPKRFGICSSCINFGFVETEFTIIFAKCLELEIKRLETQKVTDCTFYKHKGEMTLWSMKEIAILIDIPKNKMKLGFNNNGEDDDL